MINTGITGPTESTYQVGCRVRWLGCEGTITDDESSTWHQWITVLFDNGREVLFTKDGYYAPGFAEGRLEVIGKVRPKVKRMRYAYVAEDGAYYVTRQSLSVDEMLSRSHINMRRYYPIPETESYDTTSEVETDAE